MSRCNGAFCFIAVRDIYLFYHLFLLIYLQQFIYFINLFILSMLNDPIVLPIIYHLFILITN